MSAETTPTSVTSGTSRPFATRLVPTRTSSAPARERVEDPVGGALALDHVAVEAPDPQVGEPRRTSRSTRSVPAAEVADAGRAAGRAARASGHARPQWWQRSDVPAWW